MLRKTSRTALSFAVTTYKALESTNPIPIKGKGIISRLSDITIGVHKDFYLLTKRNRFTHRGGWHDKKLLPPKLDWVKKTQNLAAKSLAVRLTRTDSIVDKLVQNRSHACCDDLQGAWKH